MYDTAVLLALAREAAWLGMGEIEVDDNNNDISNDIEHKRV